MVGRRVQKEESRGKKGRTGDMKWGRLEKLYKSEKRMEDTDRKKEGE